MQRVFCRSHSPGDRTQIRSQVYRALYPSTNTQLSSHAFRQYVSRHPLACTRAQEVGSFSAVEPADEKVQQRFPGIGAEGKEDRPSSRLEGREKLQEALEAGIERRLHLAQQEWRSMPVLYSVLRLGSIYRDIVW